MRHFFIDRPVFAWVLAIITMLTGVISVVKLPVTQYPNIAPPTITITASYPGATAKTVEDAVVQVIEQKLTGLDDLLYLNSTSDSYGQANITLTFNTGIDPDTAQVQVQNKLQLALPLLPLAVQQMGIKVAKSTNNFLMLVSLISEDGSLNPTDLNDYLMSNVQDPLSRLTGVGEVQIFGAPYAMRIWLDPAKLTNYGLTTSDISAAIRAQNTQISAGQLGGTPALPGQNFSAPILAQKRLETTQQFENILLRTDVSGGAIKLKDVARIALGAESYGTTSRLNGKPAAGMGIKLAAGANALDTAAAVKKKLQELEPNFPKGVKTFIPYDTTPFIKISINGVLYTIIEAIILVFLVMYLFLQNFRATLIPTIAIPVVLLGTFGVMAALGFSINTLTMFGLVLAIGLLVDDAIVVVENVERLMHDEGLSPNEATKKSMTQITGALVGIGLILIAVFVPMAFFTGSTGVIYRQFAITITSAMVLSVLVALIFTPALCATILKPQLPTEHPKAASWRTSFLGWFNEKFQTLSEFYSTLVQQTLKQRPKMLISYLVLLAGLLLLFWILPTAFLPEEDQGVMFTQVILPAGATVERTTKTVNRLEQYFLGPERAITRHVFSVIGFSFAGVGQNMGFAFVGLKDWKLRQSPKLSVQAAVGRAMLNFRKFRDALVFAFAPPAILGLGTANGFDIQLQDRAGLGHAALLQARNQFLMLARQDPRLTQVRPNGQDDVAELQLEIDHAKASAMGVSIAAINDTLMTAWGGSYVNDFLDHNRIKKVYLQADAKDRMQPEDLAKWHVRNNYGQMVPLLAFTTYHWGTNSPRLERYNGQPSVEILGQAASGYSSGAAMQAAREIAAKLPPGIGYEWTGASFQEQNSGSQAPLLYALSLLVVFLCLAALYESWTIPLAVMLVIPLGVFGAVLATFIRGLANDIYFQVGLLATIGLTAKNAILIIEFAQAAIHQEGKSLITAILEAVRIRLRPILMTSMAFGLGVLPLVLATGAGSGSQKAVGTGVLGGTIAGTILGLIFVPLFYLITHRGRPTKLPSQH